MDELDRFADELIRTIANEDPDRLQRAFPLSEIWERFLPYRHARRSVGIDNHQDYEMTILRLAAGERSYAHTEPHDAAEQLSAEAEAANPDTGLFRLFGEAELTLSSELVARTLGSAPTPPPARSTTHATETEASIAEAAPATNAAAIATDAPETTKTIEPHQVFPLGPACPHCGSTVDPEWKYCPVCGWAHEVPVRVYRVALIPGDGIGPEVIDAATPVLDVAAACHGFELSWERLPYSADHYLDTGETLPAETIENLQKGFDAILVGALGDPRVPGNEHAKDILLGLRRQLDLYINYRPVKLLHPDLTPLRLRGGEHIDMVIFRENTEGLYAGRGRVEGDTHIAEEINTTSGVQRIVRAAFEWAEAHGRKLVTMSDKSNAIPAHRVWQEQFKIVAREFGGITAEHRYVDALAMEMVRDPSRFDVIVTNNLFGDILTDLGAGLVGGLGLTASANLHPGRIGLFEPVHGSAPTLAGQGSANPFAAILTGSLMLEALGETEAARSVERGVRAALQQGIRTPDLGGSHSTEHAAQGVLDRLA